MFFLKKLPNIFYQLAIFLVIVLEILAPIVILYSLQTDMYSDLAYFSSVGLAIHDFSYFNLPLPTYEVNIITFMKNLTATGSLMLLSTLF